MVSIYPKLPKSSKRSELITEVQHVKSAYGIPELEAEHTGVGSNLITKNLDQRRLQREPCDCPIADRPRDT